MRYAYSMTKEHRTLAEGTAAYCSCGWSIDYRYNRYMSRAIQEREAKRAARLHPVEAANRHHNTVPRAGGYTGD